MKEQFDALKDSQDLKDISIDMVESALDENISDEILKEVPLLKSLIAMKSIYSSYTDRIFIKKAMAVLLEMGDVNWKQRVELTSDLDDANGSGTEKILMAIDQLQTIKKSKVFGRLCRLKALKKIDVDDFLRLTKLIQDAYLEDLNLIPDFVHQKKSKKYQIDEEEYSPLYSLGLMHQIRSKPKPIEKNYNRDEYEPEYIGGEIEFDYELTWLAQKLNEHFEVLFPDD